MFYSTFSLPHLLCVIVVKKSLCLHLSCNLPLATYNALAECSRTSAMHKWHKVQRRTHGSQPLHWRHQPSQPPRKSVNSAALTEPAACHFGGSMAQTATFAAFHHQSKTPLFRTTFLTSKQVISDFAKVVSRQTIVFVWFPPLYTGEG